MIFATDSIIVGQNRNNSHVLQPNSPQVVRSNPQGLPTLNEVGSNESHVITAVIQGPFPVNTQLEIDESQVIVQQPQRPGAPHGLLSTVRTPQTRQHSSSIPGDDSTNTGASTIEQSLTGQSQVTPPGVPQGPDNTAAAAVGVPVLESMGNDSPGLVSSDDMEATPPASLEDIEYWIRIGIAHEGGVFGYRKDHAEAMRLYLRAAAYEHPRAEYRIGMMYFNGRGVEADIAQAMVWLQKCANQGDDEGQLALGLMYDTLAAAGERRYFNDAAIWYQQAAIQGQKKAQFLLVKLYSSGHGVPQNDQEAFEWYRRSAVQGFLLAQRALIKAYWHGKGTPRARTMAFKWWVKAVTQGRLEDN